MQKFTAKFLLVVLPVLWWSGITAPYTTAASLSNKALVFSLDQGFSNGIIETQDMVSLQRMIDLLKQFQSNYEVYALLSPINADKGKVTKVLDTLAGNNIPFVLEVYSSGDFVIGNKPQNKLHDLTHGISLSLEQLQNYKQVYKDKFAGIRFMEVFAENYTILACKQLNVNWCDYFKDHLPADNFYQKSLAEPLIKFAKDNGMFAIWSDFYWSLYHPWEFDQTIVRQPQNEQELQELLTKYPGTVVVSFANNEPAEGSRTKIDTWQEAVQPFVQHGAKGFGLSDQSWMCESELSAEGGAFYNVNANKLCPISEIAQWATKAFDKGAKVVQFEPVWYLWQLPKGELGKAEDYTKSSLWALRGMPSFNLLSLAESLGVTITRSGNLADQLNNLGNFNNTASSTPSSTPSGLNYSELLTGLSTGTLVNDNGTVYLISGRNKIPFTNYQAFVGLGYSLKNVIQADISAYNEAQTYWITTADAEHPWGSWLLNKGTVYYSHESGLIGVPSYDVFLNNGGEEKFILPANKHDLKTLADNPNLSVLKNNDFRIYR